MSAHARSLLAHLHRLAAPAAPDAVLLSQWIEQRNEDAFAALTARHGPMVLGVCRRILGDVQDAEDVFQATFLVFSRRAAKLRRTEALASFLYGIALRLARKARAAQRRQPLSQWPSDAPEPTAPQASPLDVLSGRELLALIDAEIGRLPETQRLPVLLCLLQGRTVEEAARQLGRTIGSVRGCLARGREQLRQRLSRRGLDLSLGAVALLAPVAVPPRLLAESLRSLIVPSSAVAALLSSGVSLLKWKTIFIAFMLVAAGSLAAGLSFLPAPVADKPAASPANAPPAQAKDEPRRDRYGDPLPPGAVARLGTLRFRLNTHRILQLAFAPDGKSLAASSGALHLLDAASGKRMKTIEAPDADFLRFAYSPDGKRLMTNTRKRNFDSPQKTMVEIRDAISGRKISATELEGVCWLGWSAKGEAQAACLGKEEIIYHELAQKRKRRLPLKDCFRPALVEPCRCVAAKNRLAVSDVNGVIHIWDLTDGKERFALHPGVYVMSLSLSADGRWLAAISRDAANKNPVQLWDMDSGKIVRTLPPGYEVLFASDGKTLAVKGWSDLAFYDTASGRERSRIRTVSYGFADAIAFAPDGKTFATTEQESGAIQLWNVADGTPKPQPQGHTYHRLPDVAFAPDGKRVATSGGLDGTIRIWDMASGESLLRFHRKGWARACAFSADGRTLFSCWTDDKLHFDDAADGRELHALKVEDPDRPKMKPSGLSLHLSDDRARVTVFHTDDERGMDMLVTVWDTATRKQLFRRRRVEDTFWNALSADGRTLVAAHAGAADGVEMSGRIMGLGPMHLEDVASGEKLLRFPTLPGQTVPLAFSPDGRLLISYTDGTLDSGKRGITLRLWEVATAKELRSFLSSFSLKAAFSPEGRLLATTTEKGEILVWDLRQGKEHQRFRSFGARVTALAFSPDGRRLISGLSDSTLLVWEVRPYSKPRVQFTVEDVMKAWDELVSTDAPRAFQARGVLAAAPDAALPLLTKHLHPLKPADPQRLRRLLADLESDTFAVREKAQEELEKLGDLAEPALRRTLEDKPTLEVRKRVQSVLERLRGPVTRPEVLQALRAVAVLEDIGTPQARRLLEELATGTAEARSTKETKASLQRLQRRK